LRKDRVSGWVCPRTYYERQRDIRRQIAHHVGKLGDLGFEVTLCRTPGPGPDGTGQTQAA
jgi:hypothetical protein